MIASSPENGGSVFLTCQGEEPSNTIVIISAPQPYEPIQIEIIDPEESGRIVCTLPLHCLLKITGWEENGKSTINISGLVHSFGFSPEKTTPLIVKLLYKGQLCEIKLNLAELPQYEIIDEALWLTESIGNRKEDVSRQLAHILREQRQATSSNESTCLEEELNFIFSSGNVQWLNEITCNQELKTLSFSLIKSLEPVFSIDRGKLTDSTHPLIKFGTNTNNGLRKIIHLLKNKIVPDAPTIKYAMVAEARYGSFRNAEILTILFLELFRMKFYRWRSGKNNELLSLETSQLLISFSLLVRHAPSAKLAVYYFEMVKTVLKQIGLGTKPSNVLIACVVFNLAISCNSVEDQEGEEIVKMKMLIEFYYEQGKSNSDNRSVLDSIYQSYKITPSIPVPTPTIEDETDMDDNTSVISFSSTLTCEISIDTTLHAHRRMFERGIDEDEVKRCIKHGVRKLSKEAVKCTDENCIVIYKFVGKVPHIITVYRHTLVRAPEIESSEICDYLLTVGFYGDYNNCKIVLKELLESRKAFNDEEKEDLAETLMYLFKDCCPTFEGLELIIKVMKFYKIVYKSETTFSPKFNNSNTFGNRENSRRKFFK